MKKEQRLEESRKTYVPPAVTRGKLEDRRVVAMGVCKESLENKACQAADNPTAPGWELNPS